MPQTLQELTIFLSCPEELATERDLVLLAVDELNTILKLQKGVVLNVVHWKKDVIPGMSSEPQQLINDQVGSNYDIFLGLLGARFGTPTKQFGSGTEEEFENAYERAKGEAGKVWILFYFRSSTDIPIDKLDPDQLAKVQKFKAKLGPEKGVLYGSFSTPDEFLKTVKKHLLVLVSSEWDGAKWKSSATTASHSTSLQLAPALPPEVVVTEEDSEGASEVGILEVMAEATANVQIAVDVMSTIGEKMNASTAFVNVRGVELTQLTAAGKLSPQAAIKLIDEIAADLEGLTRVMKEGTPVFDSNIGAGFEKSRVAFEMYSQQTGNSPEMSAEALQGIRGLPDLIQTFRERLSDLRKIMQGLPTMTARFNRARRAYISELDRLRASLTVQLGRARDLIEVLPVDAGTASVRE